MEETLVWCRVVGVEMIFRVIAPKVLWKLNRAISESPSGIGALAGKSLRVFDCKLNWWKHLSEYSANFFNGEFDSGSERTLAAWIRHASRALITG